jgi:hypothetical protein
MLRRVLAEYTDVSVVLTVSVFRAMRKPRAVNVGKLIPGYMALHPGRESSSKNMLSVKKNKSH